MTPVPSPPPAPLLVPTFGRLRELELVDDVLDRARFQGAALVLSGPAAVGTSHLLQAAETAATARGFVTRAAAGVRSEASLPGAGLNQLLLPWRHELHLLTPASRELLQAAMGLSHAEVVDPEDADLVAAAVRTLLDRMRARRPLLLLVDDLQWMDPLSLAVLGAVGRSLTGTQVGLLGSVHPRPESEGALTDLPVRPVRPLDREAATSLVLSRHPEIGGRALDRLLKEACGYPLMLCELAGALVNGDSLACSPRSLPVSDRLTRAFSPQLGDLPPKSRSLLLLAALATDEPATQGWMPLGLDGAELRQLAPAESLGLVELARSDGRLRFAHPLVRPTVVALATDAEKRAAHAQLAERGPDSDGRVLHLARIARVPDERLASDLELVARRSLRRGDATAAAGELRRSAELTPDGPGRARRLTDAAYVELDLAGGLMRVEGLLAQAHRLDPLVTGSLRTATLEASILLHSDGDVRAAHRRLAAPIGTHLRRGAPMDDETADALHLWAEVCSHAGHPDLLRPVAGTCRSTGSLRAELQAVAVLSAESFTAGRWDEAIALADEGRRSSDRNGYDLASRGFLLDRALVAAARGSNDEVAELTTAVAGWAGPRGARLLQLRCHQARALSALGRADYEEAYQQAMAVSPQGCVSASPQVSLALTLDLVEAAVRTHRRDEATAHARAAQGSLHAAVPPRLVMLVTAAVGVVSTDDESVREFTRALAVEGAARWPFDQARVRLAYGERLRRMRASTESRPHLAAAADTFTRLGALPWAARAQRELEATTTSKVPAESCGLDALTAQERKVAQLAAAGLTNKHIAEQLFISPRTVGAHLNHAFPKLGITRRASLRDALGRPSTVAA